MAQAEAHVEAAIDAVASSPRTICTTRLRRPFWKLVSRDLRQAMTTTVADAMSWMRCQADRLIFGLTHTYTGYP